MIRPVLESAVSAFHSAVQARSCAKDKDGETTLHGRGETERERLSLIHWSNTVFGVLDKNCTLTPGGTPIPRTEDAVSEMASLCGGGEVAEIDPFSDGVDIFLVELWQNLFHFKTLQQQFTPTHSKLVLVLTAAFVF